MHDSKELCERIQSIYPEIGECGIDLDVAFDESKKAWVVDLIKDEHRLKTHLEPEDANTCIEGKHCVSLGLQISQLVSNIRKV